LGKNRGNFFRVSEVADHRSFCSRRGQRRINGGQEAKTGILSKLTKSKIHNREGISNMNQKTVRWCLLLVSILFPYSLAQAQTLFIPQIVDGGAWLTTIPITNTGATQTTVSLSFFQETGNGNTSSWNLAFVENVQTSNIVLPAGSTLFLHTTGSAASTTIGWGQLHELDNAGSVVAYAIFTVTGAALQNGTAPAAGAASRILVPFDNTKGSATSIAIANTTTSSETINVGIRINGATSQPASITLPAQGHTSFDFPTKFGATVAGQSGLAEFYAASGSFAILGLRFQSGAFTTAPVYTESGPPLIASGGSGSVFDGNYTGSYSSTLASGPVAATVSSGTLTVTNPGSGTGTVSSNGQVTFGVELAAGASCNFSGNLTLMGTAATGSGTFSCTSPTFSGTWSLTRQ
jgi:hypothetical protein